LAWTAAKPDSRALAEDLRWKKLSMLLTIDDTPANTRLNLVYFRPRRFGAAASGGLHPAPASLEDRCRYSACMLSAARQACEVFVIPDMKPAAPVARAARTTFKP